MQILRGGAKSRLHGIMLPDDNDDKVKDVVFVTEVFPLKSKQLHDHLHSKYNGEDYVADL